MDFWGIFMLFCTKNKNSLIKMDMALPCCHVD